MKKTKWVVYFMSIIPLACSRKSSLPAGSKYNVISQLNDTAWFATGKAVRLLSTNNTSNSIRQFNLQIVTDIDYVGNSSATRSSTVNGCIEDCISTQRLHIYNISLRKGNYKLSELDKRRSAELDKTHYWLLINGSGVRADYQLRDNDSGWLRVTRFDQTSNTISGRFQLTLSDTANQVVRFRGGLFSVKLITTELK